MIKAEKFSTNKAYDVVTSRIIEAIETTGQLPWRRPWNKGRMPLCSNKVSGKRYNGINAFMTAFYADMQGYDSHEWVTYKQAQELGGNIKKGEKGIPCVFFSMLDSKKEKDKKIPFLRYSTIFNLSQCDGIEYETPIAGPKYEHSTNEHIEGFIASFHDIPKIEHANQTRAFYVPKSDYINIPHISEFKKTKEYYSTLFHELTHSTGHKDRLDRKGIAEMNSFGTHEYSKEELIAELGACFLCSDAGIFNETEANSIAYLAGWLKALKENPNWLVSAANAAQKAVNFLYGKAETQIFDRARRPVH